MRPIRKLFHLGAEKFERDSHAWGLAWQHGLMFAVIPIIIVLVMIAIVPFFDVFVWITAEDSVIEWFQFLLVLASSITFARLGMLFIQRRLSGVGVLYFAIALGTFFIAGEEIAWGQRIFGWGTPEALEAVNAQKEMTVHNIYSFHQPSVYATMLAGLYGAFVPLLAWMLWSERPSSLLSYLLMPPLCLVPAFLMPFGYRLSRLAFDLDVHFPHLIFPITKFSEVAELCLYFGLIVFARLNLRLVFKRNPSLPGRLYAEESSPQPEARSTFAKR